MSKSFLYCVQVFFVILCSGISAQTVLYPGDIAVLGVVTDMGPCGLQPQSDEISFVCFQDITNQTTIDITDNAYEYLVTGNGLWGDGEGTIHLRRTGATIAKGTVITLHTLNTGGIWTYKMVSPDVNWAITYLNNPSGGPLDVETGGDQIYFMQGGTWDSHGGGQNKATYDNGRILFGYNTLGTWATNSTSQQSNLHPDVIPCYHVEAGGNEFFKYRSLFTSTNQIQWMKRITDASNWTAFADCTTYLTAVPQYQNGYSIPINNLNMGVSCINCSGCVGAFDGLLFSLPSGFLYDVQYTDGTNTFQLLGIPNGFVTPITYVNDVTYSLVSVTTQDGCIIPPNFTGEATIDVLHHNPGTHNELWICPDWGTVNLPLMLGPHDDGGTWSPPLDPIFHTYYVTFWGPGNYYYVFDNGPDCPKDSASIFIHHIVATNSIIEIGCDVNGTPNDTTDDRLVVTLTFIAPGFGPTYTVTPLFYGVPTGMISPTMGTTGVPMTFTLDPGTATGNNLTLLVTANEGFACTYRFPLPAPGFCSDPCDPNMTAEISGDEEICVNSCPDNPAKIFVDITGGQAQYKMDLTLSATGFPVWNLNGLVIDQNTEIDVCVDNIPAPVYDEGLNLLRIPKLLAGHYLNITFQNVYGKYDCPAILTNNQLSIFVHALPTISSTNLMFCKGVANNVNLTDYNVLINPFLDVTWYDGDPLNGGDLIFKPNTANLLNVEHLWAHVHDDYCENSIAVPFTILPQPDLDSVPPVQICFGNNLELQSIVLVDQGASMPVYTFHQGLPPDTTNLLDPLFYSPVDTTTIYVLATAGMCYDTLPIEIDVQDYPDFSLDGTPCDMLLHTYSILFTSSADSIHASIGTVINNPTGQDSIKGIPENVNVTIEILNPSGLCKDTFSIVAPNCNCPLIAQPVAAQPSYTICEGNPIPVLSVNSVGALVVNWYNIPSGGVPLLQNSLTYQPATATTANYYAEVFDPSNGCNSIRTLIPFVVNPDADLQMLADPVLCETQTINFNTFIPGVLNGVGGNGQWFNLITHLPISGSIQPQNGNSWYYLFTSAPGNCVSSDTVTAIVNPLPAIHLVDILCDDTQLTYDISFTSDADVIVPSTGNLSQVAGTDSFLLSDIPFDTDIQFDLQYTLTGCTASIFQAAPDCSCPALLQSTSSDLCSAQGTVDLSTFVGFGVAGNWQIVSSPPGSNPATLVGSNFQGQNKDAGTYVLRFIRSVILANCIDTALFQMRLHKSPFADAGSNVTVCAPGVINLSGTAGGDNVVFSWVENGAAAIANPNALNTTYTPTLADISAGSVNFTLNAVDQTGTCPTATETITVTIDGSAYFILNPATQTYCDTEDVQVNLDPLITFGTTNGVWFFPDTVSAPITGSSFFNPSTLAAGNYSVFYTTTNAVLPCKNDTVAVNLIIRNCSCPSVALSVPGQGVCSKAATQNLNDFLITAEPGKWTIVSTPPGSSPATLSGSNFITNNSDAGFYHLRFTLNNPIAGCDDFAEITLEVVATPSIQISSADCASDLQSWQAVVITTAATLTNTQGTLTSLGGNKYRIDGLTLNTSLQLTASNGLGLCTTDITIPAPDCACTLAIANLPDDASLCPGDKITFSALVSGGKGTVTNYWIDGSDTLFQSSLEVSTAGIYHFASVDALGCKQEKFIDVSVYTEMVPDASVVDITCPGDNDGQIILNDIVGGNGPFFISVNGGNMQPVLAFPYEIKNLSAGIYKIELLDGFSCSITFNLMVSSVSAETLNLGPDKTILVGDSLFINPVISFVPDSFYWVGDLSLIDPLKLDNWIKPEIDQTYMLFAIDQKGCLYSDDLNIRVLLHSGIYIPTIFSPNDDDINDVLIPLADPSVVMFDYFEIYSRWGELVYSVKNFAPNQTNIGWDGSFNGKKMKPGVFVYRVSAKNKKGKTIQKTGDITLIK